MHDDFILTGDGLWKFFASRRLAQFMHNGSIHGWIFPAKTALDLMARIIGLRC